ncbi:hypothetical protein M8C21_022433 [Ambrosia artemisiifolia]|uniref:PWWP domain-containing protein n=1 Tax=Ambrosia artemisiifolia TaxID=4212 RepID=A0AAD5D3S6_AMBAR|nr:hypothetical protein M8C21_022433 [Ambrosia artemisiifolia]
MSGTRKNENRNGALELTPSRSQPIESREICTTAGRVVWAKADGKFWWPAEILGERSNPAPSVLVQHFGKEGSVWVDPAIDLSPFEEEVSYPLPTSRKVLRRFKIMRSLGLAAPVGSPFNSFNSS